MIAPESPFDSADLPAGPDALVYPCSQSQLRFWIEEQLAPKNPALNVAVRWRLDGVLPHAILTDAWQRLVARHEPLRMSFSAVDGQPVAVVMPHVTFAVPLVDLRALPEPERLAEAERLAQIEARTPFDIATAPLIRVRRLLIADETTILLVTAHHAVCDGWSIGVLAREMGQLCAALTAGAVPLLPELRVRFGEFAAWENDTIAAGGLEAEREAVRAMLHGSTQFELLPDYRRPQRLTSNGAIASRLLERSLTDGLAAVAAGNGCTLFMTALAALFTLFSRHTGETDIVLGTQVVGRDDEDLEPLVGCFINTIALRADVSGDPDFVTLLERTRDMVSDSFDVRALPLQQLVEIANPVRDPSRNALFSVNFIFQRSFITNAVYGGMTLTDLPSRSAGALYDINMFMVERPEGWRVSCEYNTDLYAPATIDGLLDQFRTLLAAIVADPHRRVAEFDILGPAGRAELIVAANQTQRAYPADRTLPELVAETAARTPGTVAVVCGSEQRSYREVNVAMRRIAAALAARGCTPGTRVGIVLDRSIEMVVAMLGTLAAGCAYVPLDPAFPADRLAFIAADAKLATAITRSALRDRIDLAGIEPLLVDDHAGAANLYADSGPGMADDSVAGLNAASLAGEILASPANDAAYVIYTSGSTGKPKGVVVPHRALTNFLWAMREQPGLTVDDTLVAVTTISFDIAGLELFLPLIVGAKLVIAKETDVVDGSALAGLLRTAQATVMQATPVTWQLLVDAGWSGQPDLRMLCGGEALPRPLADELLARGTHVWNMYGPTETTIWSAAGRVAPGTGPVLIPPPIANTQFYVLDAAGRLVPPGVAGELYIGGDGLAHGYFERDALTRERFVTDPFSGIPGARLYRTGDVVRRRGAEFEFLGRTDHQVKLRGFRIELDEIAAVLLRAHGVAEAVAVVAPDAGGEPALRAYVVAELGAVADIAGWPAVLRAQISEFLPNYMLPAGIIVLDRLPRTPNGKIDRAALPRIPVAAGAVRRDAPVTPTETQLFALVTELLGVEHVNRTDDLFVHGLHSLLAVRLAARIGRACGLTVALRTVFDHPTIAALAAVIDADAATAIPAEPAAPEPIVVYNARGTRPPFVFFHNDAAAEGLFCRRLAATLGADIPLIAVSPHGTSGLPALTSVETMARDYRERLRALVPAAPLHIGGFCAGGLVAYELARIMRADGEAVPPVLLVNASAPPRRAVLFGDRLLRRVGLDARLKPELRAAACWTIVRFFDALGTGPLTASRFVAGRLGAAVRRLTGSTAARLNEPEPINPNPTETETRSYFANLIAAYTYHPLPYAGKVVFMWGSDQPPTSGGPTTGWNRVAADITVVPLPGRHMTPVKEGVEDLGRRIAMELAAE